MTMKPFQPKAGGTFFIANAVAASTPAALSESCDQVVLYNSSATALAFWRCQSLTLQSDAGSSAVVPTAGGAPAVGDVAIPPGQQIRLSVGLGPKKYSVIASAADGNFYITTGHGN
jgi:hypothetical protein